MKEAIVYDTGVMFKTVMAAISKEREKIGTPHPP
jgi:hypothetical protein